MMNKMERREYELMFGSGPLGLTLQPQYNGVGDFPLVTILRCVPGQQAEAFGQVTDGDCIIAVRDRKVESFLEYGELIKFLRDSKRPLKIRFSSKSSSSPAERVRESIQARQDALESALNREEIQLDEIRSFARSGLFDKHRALVWKLLLGNLPVKASLENKDLRQEWAGFTLKERDLYETYKREMFASHARKDEVCEDGIRPPVRMEGQAWYDQPVSESTVPVKPIKKVLDEEDRNEFESVEDVLDDDIWKDVQRTHPGYHFFTQPTYIRMHRILYIYGRLNSGVGYVQGMNEILAPIVYVFGAYPNSDEENFESNSFFSFAALMSDVRDMFIRSLDGEKSGLHGQIQRLEEMVTRHDPTVARHLKELDLNFQFFSVRWLTTLLTREFDLPDALRLWDSMLGSSKRFHFILCCCTAMILAKRDFLLDNDFPTCLKSLQAPCSTPVETVVREAERIGKLELSGRTSLTSKSFFVPPKLNKNVEAVASDLFRMASRVARTVVDEAKLVVEDFKQHNNKASTNHLSSKEEEDKDEPLDGQIMETIKTDGQEAPKS